MTGLAPAIQVFAQSVRPSMPGTRFMLGPAKPRVPGMTMFSASSLRRYHVVIVDERIERALDVDIGFDDAGLLQRQSRGENGVTLRLADLAVRQIGAFAQLLLHHILRQLGGGDEALF